MKNAEESATKKYFFSERIFATNKYFVAVRLSFTKTYGILSVSFVVTSYSLIKVVSGSLRGVSELKIIFWPGLTDPAGMLFKTGSERGFFILVPLISFGATNLSITVSSLYTIMSEVSVKGYLR